MARRLVLYIQDIDKDSDFLSDPDVVICTKFTDDAEIDEWVEAFRRCLPKRLLERTPTQPTGRIIKP